MPATSAAARSRGKARRVSRAAPAARTAPAAVVRRPLSPPPGPGCGAASCCGGCSANQAAQQNENAQLTLAWWRRPLRLQASVLQTDVALSGEPDDPDVDRLPPAQPAPRRRAPVGSGLPAAGALGVPGRGALPD